MNQINEAGYGGNTSTGNLKNINENIPKSQYRIKQPNPKSIVRMVEEEMEKLQELEEQNNREYHFKKNKVFDVYAKPRTSFPKVKSIYQTNPMSAPNVKHIEIESQTDRRVKISSMARRLYIPAPSTNQIRNEGHHQNLIKSLDKNNKHEELMIKRNLMQTSASSDALQKDLSILPESINFGTIKAGTYYETKCLIKNEDSIIQRVRVVQPNNLAIKCYQKSQGPIAAGMSREIIVRFTVVPGCESSVYETFQIHSKYKIYTVPVMAAVVGMDGQINSMGSKLPYSRFEVNFCFKLKSSWTPLRKRVG
jgi:hypothetical protein